MASANGKIGPLDTPKMTAILVLVALGVLIALHKVVVSVKL